MDIKSLNILNWDARSIKDNEDELFNFLRVHNVHVAVITETYLKPAHKVKRDPNYFVYRNDRLNGAGGGVAIIVHRRIKHQILSSFVALETKDDINYALESLTTSIVEASSKMRG